jgi:transposase-like protein
MRTFNQLLSQFQTEDDCKRFLIQRRWPDGVIKCPRCQSPKVFHATHKPFHWICKSGLETVDSATGKPVTCHKRNGYRFSVITKTIFENTKFPLRAWFQVMFLMGHAKKGISAHQIYRTMGTGSYETAWYMCTRIRAAMKDAGLTQLLGEVEVDETFVGGKAQNMHASKRNALGLVGTKGKIPVIGAISRKGNVVCRMIENTDTPTLDRFVREVTDRAGVKLLTTDEHSGYRLLGHDYNHRVVRHGQGEYVVGTTHTNSIESFWSLLKRGIMGSYHKVSKQYLPLYLNEFQFRFNNRKNPDIFDLIVAGC